jgi:hypothetical protein
MPMPFSSDNPPPLVSMLDFFKFIADPCSYESIPIIYQDLYPACLVDAEVSDSTHDGQDDPRAMMMEAREHLQLSRLFLI